MDRMMVENKSAESDNSDRSARLGRSREERFVSMFPYSNIEPILEEDSVKTIIIKSIVYI